MTDVTKTKTETCADRKIVVNTNVDGNTTSTTTSADNQTTVITCSETETEGLGHCPCGNLDLEKLLEKTRCWAFKSSNISAAVANSVLIFAMKILQQILIQQCKEKNFNFNNIFLIASAIGELAEVINVYNPQPFNS